ncbi:MAG TPA: hypothetical protein VE199_02810 [Nitrososphaera sp.]|jgi:hypothetical protein|nr:hypothetical protein [Nitrososphaera sp.]
MSNEKQTINNKQVTKGGAGPASNVSFDPERGYGTSEQKEKIRKAGE